MSNSITTTEVASSSSQGGVLQPSTDFSLEGHDEEQIRLMEERCIVLSYDDEPIRDGSKKECHLMTNINKGLLHRAFSCFLFDPFSGKLLLQRRAPEKITFPNMWTNTCCSHPLSVKSELEEAKQIGVRRAAQRKLDHELGIPPEQVPLDDFQYLTRIHYLAPSDGLWGEHEIDYILFITASVTLKPNENEVCDTRWVDSSELKTLMNELDPDAFTPWFKLIASEFLIPWWDKLLERRTNGTQIQAASSSGNVIDAKSLGDLQDNKIHRML
ncbi:hypothetical protein CBS101457_001280 [Exobasidium rhododendri]|nr:hypothetical protein CBS101457_001280 [Exobasidium rhododendri]